MKIFELKEIDRSIRQYLKTTDFENMFNVYKDKNNFYVHNLNSTLYLKFDSSMLLEYVCTTQSSWTLISYKLYQTTRLAWLLMKINDVKAIDIFKIKQPGDTIKYLDSKYVKGLIESINGEQNGF